VSKCKNNQPKRSKFKDVDNLVEKFPLHLTPEQIDLARDLQREAGSHWLLNYPKGFPTPSLNKSSLYGTGTNTGFT